MIVSGKQQGDSATHIYESVLSNTPLPSRLPHIIEQNSLYYIAGPCWLSILDTVVYTCQFQSPNCFPSSLAPFFPPSNHKFILWDWVCLWYVFLLHYVSCRPVCLSCKFFQLILHTLGEILRLIVQRNEHEIFDPSFVNTRECLENALIWNCLPILSISSTYSYNSILHLAVLEVHRI